MNSVLVLMLCWFEAPNFQQGALLRAKENEQRSAQRDLYSVVWAGGVRGLGAASSPVQGFTTRKGLSKEFDSALESHRKLKLRDLRLKSWLQLDATSLAICCIWRFHKGLGGRRFQVRSASQQCEVDAVGYSVQLWSCQIQEAPKV